MNFLLPGENGIAHLPGVRCGTLFTIRPNKKYVWFRLPYLPYYMYFTPYPKLFLRFGQTVHLKKKVEDKERILKEFFFDMNPGALRKAKIVYNFGLSECNGLKEKQLCFQRT